ncbi:hypothetical protein OFC00_31845, partial [Escherichia coli]|nr:hypothetical protein [Escherichia coli]
SAFISGQAQHHAISFMRVARVSASYVQKHYGQLLQEVQVPYSVPPTLRPHQGDTHWNAIE